MNENIIKLFKTSILADVQIALILLDKLDKKEIFDFFKKYGHKDAFNLRKDRPCTYALEYGAGESFTTYVSRHDFWYLTQERYTLILSTNQSDVAIGFRTPLTYLYERDDSEITQKY